MVSPGGHGKDLRTGAQRVATTRGATRCAEHGARLGWRFYSDSVSVTLLREMFDRMVLGKNAELIERYYDPEFVMYSDGVRQTFAEFQDSHRRTYATSISYEIEYDDEAWVQADDKIAGRLWITTSRPGEEPTRIEVVLIAAYCNGRIHRIWEATWSKLAWRRGIGDLLISYRVGSQR
jgi:hypothetical protein